MIISAGSLGKLIKVIQEQFDSTPKKSRFHEQIKKWEICCVGLMKRCMGCDAA